MSTEQWVLLGLAALLVSWIVGAYNRLMGLRNQIVQATAQVDEPLRRRDELLAGMLTLMAPLAEHLPETERHMPATVGEVAASLMSAASSFKAKPLLPDHAQRLAKAELALKAALTPLLLRVQTRTELRLSPGMVERLAALSEAERRLRFGRQLYNDAVEAYNEAVQQWPTRLLRKPFGWELAGPL